MSQPPALLLASQSPRRKDLLAEAGYAFQVGAVEVEEVHDAAAPILELTALNAHLKAQAASAKFPDALILAADTLVACNGEALGKPRDLDDARAMLSRLAGRTHQVATAVTLYSAAHGIDRQFIVTTDVRFLPLDAAGIEDYLQQVHVLDKAGAYAAQDHPELIIAEITGSRTNVIGLPMERLTEELTELGITPKRE
jgi:septum formation protein